VTDAEGEIGALSERLVTACESPYPYIRGLTSSVRFTSAKGKPGHD
jgi:hypothetical protein